MQSNLLFFVAVFSFIYLFNAESVETESTDKFENVENSTENLNETVPQDLYVIKTVVYEVGILTDAANDTDNTNETHEQVDLSFYNPLNNGSIDLTNIPLPIQTNVSGVSVTGLLPGSNLASILLPPGISGVQGPVLPKKQVTVTQNISTSNPDKGSEIISNLPKILGLTSKNDSQKENVEVKSEEKNIS